MSRWCRGRPALPLTRGAVVRVFLLGAVVRLILCGGCRWRRSISLTSLVLLEQPLFVAGDGPPQLRHLGVAVRQDASPSYFFQSASRTAGVAGVGTALLYVARLMACSLDS